MKRLIPILCLLLAVCACSPERYHVTQGHTHTYYRITYRYDRPLDNEIRDEIQRFYHSLNPFDSLSIVSAVNANRDVEVDGRTYGGMLNIGCRPTLANGDNTSIEVHIFDFNADIYQHPMRLSFVRRIRAERKFASVEELAEQLHRDAEAARGML